MSVPNSIEVVFCGNKLALGKVFGIARFKSFGSEFQLLPKETVGNNEYGSVSPPT